MVRRVVEIVLGSVRSMQSEHHFLIVQMILEPSQEEHLSERVVHGLVV